MILRLTIISKFQIQLKQAVIIEYLCTKCWKLVNKGMDFQSFKDCGNGIKYLIYNYIGVFYFNSNNISFCITLIIILN